MDSRLSRSSIGPVIVPKSAHATLDVHAKFHPGSLLTAVRARMPAGFGALIAAQFASSLADNALLIITMALLHQRGLPAWWAPLLKLGFTVSYVVFAPVLGPLADAVPKARLMLWMTGVKVAGVAGMVAGLNPIVAFCIVGFGASAYAPAKYGLVTEIVGCDEPGSAVPANVVFPASRKLLYGSGICPDQLTDVMPRSASIFP